MSFDPKRAVAVMRQIDDLRDALVSLPSMQPIAREMLTDVLDGAGERPKRGRRRMSLAQKRALSVAAKKRWARVKKEQKGAGA